MGAPDRAPTRETVQMNGPAGLRGLVALALALAIPPCASGATNLCGGTALGPLDATGSEVLSIALLPIAGRQELQPPWELASTGSTALTPTTLREGIASGAIPTITLVTTTTVLPVTTLTLSTTTFTLPVTTLTLEIGRASCRERGLIRAPAR